VWRPELSLIFLQNFERSWFGLN
jgi:hypothetical protein